MKNTNLPPMGPLINFSKAAEHQSFTKAAQELNLTHGAISRSVQQLEQYFGISLFQRRNRRIYLTDKGQFFAAKVTTLLAELELTCEQMSIQSNGSSLAVSCEPSLAMRWLMPRLKHFNDQFAAIDVHLSTAGGPVDLAAQNLHLAIRRSDFQSPADYWVTPLGRERIGLVCHPNYWARNCDKSMTLLHTRTRPAAWSDWLRLSDQAIDTSKEQYFDHFYFSLQAAVAGLGLAIGPEHLVADDIDNGHLLAPFGFVETRTEYVALSLQNPQRVGYLHDFVSWLQREFG